MRYLFCVLPRFLTDKRWNLCYLHFILTNEKEITLLIFCLLCFQLTAFGGYLKYTVSYDIPMDSTDSDLVSSVDVIIQVIVLNGKGYIVWMHKVLWMFLREEVPKLVVPSSGGSSCSFLQCFLEGLLNFCTWSFSRKLKKDTIATMNLEISSVLQTFECWLLKFVYSVSASDLKSRAVFTTMVSSSCIETWFGWGSNDVKGVLWLNGFISMKMYLNSWSRI